MPVAQIVKLGGAAITEKQQLECLNEAILGRCAKHLKEVYSCNAGVGLVVVHGAGSFGHFQASEAGVDKGGIQDAAVRKGFVDTRVSVMKLNQEVVKALVAEGVPAVGVSVCGHWLTEGREITHGPVKDIQRLLDAGLVAVLHGDAVIDAELGCTILSGDTIIKHLSQYLSPQYVVFLTNVPGVYNQPPENPGAELIREILVQNDGSWKIAGASENLRLTASEHDTTGGIQKKIQEAVSIAQMGIDVLIAEAASKFGLDACQEGPTVSSEWVGTHVKAAKQDR